MPTPEDREMNDGRKIKLSTGRWRARLPISLRLRRRLVLHRGAGSRRPRGSRASPIRASSRAPGAALPRTSAVRGAMASSSRPSQTQSTSVTRNCSNGAAAASTRSRSISTNQSPPRLACAPQEHRPQDRQAGCTLSEIGRWSSPDQAVMSDLLDQGGSSLGAATVRSPAGGAERRHPADSADPHHGGPCDLRDRRAQSVPAVTATALRRGWRTVDEDRAPGRVRWVPTRNGVRQSSDGARERWGAHPARTPSPATDGGGHLRGAPPAGSHFGALFTSRGPDDRQPSPTRLRPNSLHGQDGPSDQLGHPGSNLPTFRQNATVEDLNTKTARGLDKALLPSSQPATGSDGDSTSLITGKAGPVHLRARTRGMP